jgi:hypothetical protein
MRVNHLVTADERLVEPGHHRGHRLVRELSHHLHQKDQARAVGRDAASKDPRVRDGRMT